MAIENEPVVTDPKAEDKPTFTPEQQAYLNNVVIKEAQGRAAKDVRAENARLLAEIAALKEGVVKEPETVKTEAKPGEATPDFKAEVERIKREFTNELKLSKQDAKAKADEAAALKLALASRDKNDAIRTAMDSLGVDFVNRNAALKLSEDAVVWDEDRKRFVVHDSKGVLRFNSSLEPMDLVDYYQTFVNENPYLVKAQVRGGTGSKESASIGTSKHPIEDIFGSKSKGALANKLALENPGEYKRLKALAKEQGLI